MAGNTFLFAFFESDLFGKLIFVALFLLSIVSWSLIIHKVWHVATVRKASQSVEDALAKQRGDPLALEFSPGRQAFPNPFWKLFSSIKQSFHALQQGGALSEPELRVIEARASRVMLDQVYLLEKNLYILSITVSLAPFLGLLGTVWGILTTFSELQTERLAGGQQVVLGGLSMALATTVLGLIVAIPALIGHATIKSFTRDISHRMKRFSSAMTRALELKALEVSRE